MAENFRGGFFAREALPDALTGLKRLKPESLAWETFARKSLLPRGAAVGSWSITPSDPLAEVLVVRDEDLSDTFAWLNSFFSSLSPITQWCRVLRTSQAIQLAKRNKKAGIDRGATAWIGAILAECSVQSGGAQNLRDLPGSAAVSTSTFAGGRAVAIWGDDVDLSEIARRHDELSLGLRDGIRQISANALIPLWSVLTGQIDKSNRSDQRALEPFVGIFSSIIKLSDFMDSAEIVNQVAALARDEFDLAELTDCSQGPQVERVRALDRLGDRLSAGPKSPAIDALLGLGASFVDPGASVSPELLRRYGRQMPSAPIWQGAFAGSFAPQRLMTDQGGLGRLISKALLAGDDLRSRPSCDIAYDELVRWITPGRPIKIDVRGMASRALSVEIYPGVTCFFSLSRPENQITNANRSDSARSSASVEKSKSQSQRESQDIGVVLDSIIQRIERLEEHSMATQEKFNFSSKDDVVRKTNKNYPSKK